MTAWLFKTSIHRISVSFILRIKPLWVFFIAFYHGRLEQVKREVNRFYLEARYNLCYYSIHGSIRASQSYVTNNHVSMRLPYQNATIRIQSVEVSYLAAHGVTRLWRQSADSNQLEELLWMKQSIPLDLVASPYSSMNLMLVTSFIFHMNRMVWHTTMKFSQSRKH